jgi:hypothetical protein
MCRKSATIVLVRRAGRDPRPAVGPPVCPSKIGPTEIGPSKKVLAGFVAGRLGGKLLLASGIVAGATRMTALLAAIVVLILPPARACRWPDLAAGLGVRPVLRRLSTRAGEAL